MQGYVAITDRGWYEHLSRDSEPRDANFWRPSARAFRFPPGMPFLFKLRAPFNAIVGFGFFAGFSVLPDWLAWETFGEANGVASLAELRARLAKIQTGANIQRDPSGRIGCCLIAESRFFAESDWITQPSDWKPRTQSGEKYDLASGEGARVWQECLARDPGAMAPEDVDRENGGERYGKPVLHRPRLGQPIFRVHVLDAYGRACAVTREHSLPVLEAAHIRPYAAGGEHDVRNGLVLRTDLHRLFDRGYVTIDEELHLVVGGRLKQEFDNGRSYYGLHGSQLAAPIPEALRPSDELLAWHRENVFVG